MISRLLVAAFIASILFTYGFQGFAQSTNSLTIDGTKEEFKPSGKIYGDLFVNGNYNLDDQFGSFRLNRLHFAYKYQFTRNWYFNGMIESALEDYSPIAQGGDYNNITNLFEFCMGYSSDKLNAKFGLIGTELNQQQEKLWKHRYVDKVYADKYGLAPTNDFGFLVIYKISPKFKIDVAVTNGEGHKNLQADSSFRYAGGATWRINQHLIARAYADMVNYSGSIQSNFIGIVGYNNKFFNVGVEWNQQYNSLWNDGFHKNGYSAYLNGNLNPKLQVFTRYDYVSSNQPIDFAFRWNEQNDGSLIITGVQYEMIKQVQVAVNYRSWRSAQENSNPASYIFLDLALSF